MSHSPSLQIKPIARISSPYKEKFAVPRQPGLVNSAEGYIEMAEDYSDSRAFDGIEGFSHLWLIFEFHGCEGKSSLKVRPPRLGGNQEMGVFATRSPFRPNNLGLSVVTFKGLEQQGDRLRLKVSGLDLIDGTPVYDIKPYVPYADAIESATGGFAAEAPAADMSVILSAQARADLLGLPPEISVLIKEVLSLDPRPAYQKGSEDGRVYGVYLDQYNVTWKVENGQSVVQAVETKE